MPNTAEQNRLEKVKAEQFVAESELLPGIENIRVELGEDQTGDPAIWLVFRLESGINFDLEMAKRFNQYARVIQTKILHEDLTRFPYTRLERAA